MTRSCLPMADIIKGTAELYSAVPFIIQQNRF